MAVKGPNRQVRGYTTVERPATKYEPVVTSFGTSRMPRTTNPVPEAFRTLQDDLAALDGAVAAARREAIVGRKDDRLKVRLDLLPWRAVHHVARVMMFGAQKYGVHNWRHVEDGERRYVTASLRHLAAHLEGETIDEESGLPALAHATCSSLFALWFYVTNATKPKEDDDVDR